MPRFLTTFEAPVVATGRTSSETTLESAPSSSSSPSLAAKAAAAAASRPARSPLRPSRPLFPSTLASPSLSSSAPSASTPRTCSGSTAPSSPWNSPSTAAASPSADGVRPSGPGAPSPTSLGTETAPLASYLSASSDSTMRPPTQVVTSNPVSYYDSTASTSDDEQQHDQSRAARRSRNRRAHASAGPSSTLQTPSEGPFRRASYEVLPKPPSTSTNGTPQDGSSERARAYGRAGTAPSVPASRVIHQSDVSRISALSHLHGNAQKGTQATIPGGLGLQNVEYGAEGRSKRNNGQWSDGRTRYVSQTGQTIFPSTNESYNSRSPVFLQSFPTSAGEGRSPTAYSGGSPTLSSGSSHTNASRAPPMRPARSARFLPDQVDKHERGRNGTASSTSAPRHNNGSRSSFQIVELQPDHIVFPECAPAQSQTRRSRSPSSTSSRRLDVIPANAVSKSNTTNHYDSTLFEYSARPASVRSAPSSYTATESESHRLYFPPPPPKQSPDPASNASLIFPSALRPAPRSPDATQDSGLFPERPRSSPKARSPVFPSASAPSSSERSTRTSALPFLGPVLSLGKTSSTKNSSIFPLFSASSRQPDLDPRLEDELDQMIRAQHRGVSPVQGPRFPSTFRSPKETNVYDDLLGEVDKVNLKVSAVNLGRTSPASPRSAPLHAAPESESLSSAFDEALAALHTRQRTISGDTLASDSFADYIDANEVSPLQSSESGDGDGKNQGANGVPRIGHSTPASDHSRRMSAIGEEAEEEVEDGDRRNSVLTLRRRSSPRNSRNLSILPPPIDKGLRSSDPPPDSQAILAETPPRRQPPSLASGLPLPSPSTNVFRSRDPSHSASVHSTRSTPSTPNRNLQSPGRSIFSLSNESPLSTPSYAGSVAPSTRSMRSITKRLGSFFSGTSSASSSPRTKSFGSKNGQLNMVGISSEAIRAAGLFQDDGPEVLAESDPRAALTNKLAHRSRISENEIGSSSSSSSLTKASEEVTQLEGLFARFEREEKERLKGITAHRRRNASAPATIGLAYVP
ncbi:BQ2448_2786 [Microbotryum intermedium]|uniref:BQ2448_2786 protein n=1 Tax=Microbotryum intermedium TaxID=269621 RepID=A0A238FJ42_9BASI|nr:BQ2448_2786 [Microbotryum intermedium]